MLRMVPSVFDIIAFGLESDVLPPDTVAVAAYVARLITILASTAVGLKPCNLTVNELLCSINLRAPPALAVISPLLLAAVMIYARL